MSHAPTATCPLKPMTIVDKTQNRETLINKNKFQATSSSKAHHIKRHLGRSYVKIKWSKELSVMGMFSVKKLNSIILLNCSIAISIVITSREVQ